MTRTVGCLKDILCCMAEFSGKLASELPSTFVPMKSREQNQLAVVD